MRSMRFYEKNPNKVKDSKLKLNKSSLELVNFFLVSHRKKAIDDLVSRMKIE